VDPLYSDESRQNPYPHYKHLREADPVHRISDTEVWAISRCEHVEEVLKRHDVYSSADLATVETSLQGGDDPEHARIRSAVSRALNPKQIAAWEAPIRELIRSAVEEATSRERFEFVADLATPLPLRVISMILDFDQDRWQDYNRWSQAAIRDEFAGLDSPTRARFDRDRADMDAYLATHLRRCRAGEARGVVNTEVIPELSDKEAVDVLKVLLVAGNETTKHLLSNMAVALIENPRLFGQLREDPALIPDMVEETLRINPPVLSIARRAVQDVQLGGEMIPANSPIFVLLGSANHCPGRFPDGDRFDLSRKQRHFAFGYGIHFCLGAGLSRLEGRLLLEAMLESWTSIEPADLQGDIRWDPHTHLRGPERLDVRVRPLNHRVQA
jgi:cytochrome P450